MMHHLETVQTVLAAVPMFDPPKPTAPPGAANVLTIVGYVSWAVAIVAFVGLLIIAGKLMVGSDGRSDTMSSLLKWFGGSVLVGIAGGLITLLLGA
ncbi:hypothetical protein AB0N24_23435 [Arthrobacter sp. NPDC093128]|jgi:hypothetical protein|uniref:hypothetical protein n=1 Tax=Arthrobacter sp. NPDC093128 TaxID=3154979 RepID=UPI003414537C